MSVLDMCIAEFELYTNLVYDSSNKQHTSVVNQMVQFKESQDGNVGFTHVNMNDIDEYYRNDYPKTILRALSRLKKRVIFL